MLVAVRGSAEGAAETGAHDGALQLRDAGRHFRLEAIQRQRALIVGQRLLVVARLIAQAAERRQRPGVVGIDGEARPIGPWPARPGPILPGVAQLDLRIGRLRARGGPIVQQLKGLLLATGLVEQDRQAAMRLGMIRIGLQALVEQDFRLLQIFRAIVERAGFCSDAARL